MGNEKSSEENINAYPHQQYQYDKAKQVKQSQPSTQDIAQPKPKPNPPPQQVQYVAVQPHPHPNAPINPYYGQQPVAPQQPQPIYPNPVAVTTAATTAHVQPPQPQQQPQQQQTVYPQLNRPKAAPVATTAVIAGTAATTAAVMANNNHINTQPPPQPQPQPVTTYAVPAQPQPAAVPIAGAAIATAATAAAIPQQPQPQNVPPSFNPQYVQQQGQPQQVYQPQPVIQQPQPPQQSGYVQVKGADGKIYMVPQGPPGTVPMVVQPKAKPKVVIKKKKKYKTWGVKIIPTSDKAKKKVRNRQYEHTTIVIGIVCEGDKFDGYNRYGGYGAYGYSSYGDLDRKKFITMKVKVTDQIAIQQNREKHYLEFWRNGQMFNKVIELDPHKKFQIRVGSTNHDYDVKLY